MTPEMLAAEIERLRTGLEFYANRENWRGHGGLSTLVPWDLDGDGIAELRYECGAVAQAVLYEGASVADVFVTSRARAAL